MRRYSNKRGFTLIELIISMAILGMIIVVFAGMLITGGTINRNALDTVGDSMQASSTLEVGQGSKVESLGTELTIKLGGEIDVKGDYIKSQVGNVEYIHFKAKQNNSDENGGESGGSNGGCGVCDCTDCQAGIPLPDEYLEELQSMLPSGTSILSSKMHNSANKNKYYVKVQYAGRVYCLEVMINKGRVEIKGEEKKVCDICKCYIKANGKQCCESN